MSKILDLKNQGKLAAWYDFRQKTLLDLSNNTNNLTPAGPINWLNGRYGSGLSFLSTGLLTTPDHASLDLTTLTILWFAEIPLTLTGSLNFLVNKHEYELLINQSTGRQQFYNRATGGSATSTIDVRGAKMCGVRIASGGYPTFFKNGSFADTVATAVTFAAGTTTLGMGNFRGAPAADYNAEGIVYSVVIANVQLTDQEISQIYNEFYAVKGAGDPKTRNYKGFMPPIDSNCVLAYDMATRTGDGKMADLSGNGKNITYTQGSLARTRSGFPSLSLAVASTATFTSTDLGTTHTLELIADDWDTDSHFLIHASFANSYCFYYDSTAVYYSNDAVNFVNWTVAALTTEEHHIVVDRNGLSMILYIDGVSQGVKTLAGNAALTVGRLALSTNPFLGKRGYMQVYSTSKGAAWASNRYKQYAKSIIYNAQPEYWLPTLANVTAGALSNTEFSVSTGSYKISEDSNRKKWIANVTPGAASRRSTEVFGTYIFEANFLSIASENSIGFISSAVGGYSSYTGYAIYVWSTGEIGILKCLGGGSSALIQSAAGYVSTGVVYQLAVSRSTSGIFRLYIKGGAYTDWTLVGTSSAELTYITSKFLTFFTSNAGSKFRLLGIHQGVLGVDQLTEIYR